ncbi:MAG: hypothetical protein ACC662_04020, partial [Planctomycetota bacterium]
MKPRPRLSLPALHVVLLGVVLAGTACAGGNGANGSNASNRSNPKNRTPSCLPPGYRPSVGPQAARRKPREVRGEELDVKLGVVEGKVITRRRLVREAGPRAPGQTEAAYERAIHRRLKNRVRLLIFVREAARMGIQVPPQRLDEIVTDQLERDVREARKTTGEPVTIESYLAEKGLTMKEYRDQLREEFLYRLYLRRLVMGLGGPTRPEVDMEVSPAEVKAIYWGHPGAFDEKPAVKVAIFQIDVERFLSDDVGFLDAEDLADERAKTLAQGFEAGGDPEALAKRFEIPDDQWSVSPRFLERKVLKRLTSEEAVAWLFDPARKATDATVLPESLGPIVVGVVEKRSAK